MTIDEASRDTRIRPEFLEALEDEDFDLLLGDVYVKGALRSYSTYLGLSPDKVVTAYARGLREPPSASAPVLPGPIDPTIAAPRRRDNHRLAILVAVTVLVLAAAFGVLSKSRSAPAPAALPSTAPPAAPVDRHVMAALLATREVEVTVTADGLTRTFTLSPGEGRSFDATTSLTIKLSTGRSVQLTVNGVDQGSPGIPRRPWQKTFSYEDQGAPPSPTG